MPMIDPKKIASLMLAKMDNGEIVDKNRPTVDMSDKKPMDSPLKYVADEIMQAMQDEDTYKLMEALKSFVEMCYEYKDDESEM